MFTGIIESIGTVQKIKKEGSNIHFIIKSNIAHTLKRDQSVAHNGICMTVIDATNTQHTVTAVKETIDRTNIKEWKPKEPLNIERALSLQQRLDGHIVLGHVDQTGICIKKEAQDGSWLFEFEYDERTPHINIEKGCICVNGVALTCFHTTKNTFSTAIIPFTYSHTNFQNIIVGTLVNLEFDFVGKYIQKMIEYKRIPLIP
ncbi:MAG: riboflavin synthase [Chitinophagaceae bacterium]|nr:riboflavin synthase [Chitinophagaceae bacterium]